MSSFQLTSKWVNLGRDFGRERGRDGGKEGRDLPTLRPSREEILLKLTSRNSNCNYKKALVNVCVCVRVCECESCPPLPGAHQVAKVLQTVDLVEAEEELGDVDQRRGHPQTHQVVVMETQTLR